MENTRIFVTGRYINDHTYVLYKEEDGSEFQKIISGQPFTIGNQLKPWIPTTVPDKKNKGTIMVCQKFSKNNSIIDSFTLPHNKKGFWALTSGAARRGVFHLYKKPRNKLEAHLISIGISKGIIEKANTIDIEFTVGDTIRYFSNRHIEFSYKYVTDATNIAVLSAEQSVFLYDVYTTYKELVCDATYLIYYTITGSNHIHILKILLTPNANESVVIDQLKKLYQ